MSEWTSVRDDVPNRCDSVIIAVKSGGVGEGYLEDERWFWVNDQEVYGIVTHWQPLPEPPGEEVDSNASDK